MTKPTQADRQLFHDLLGLDVTDDTDRILTGAFDATPQMQAIIKHREDTEKRIVEWLRLIAPEKRDEEMVEWIADAIERGDHHITNGQPSGISG
jgi:hypothetical protein